MNNLQVYILTRDRFEGLSRQLELVLMTGLSSNQITVSDNSSTEHEKKKVKALSNKLKVGYKSRNYEPTVFTHLSSCVKEIEAEYVIFLHDDDEIETDIFEKYSQITTKVKGCDALVGRAKINNKHSFLSQRNSEVQRVSINKLIAQYTYLRDPFVSVFPFYIFKVKTVKEAFKEYENLGVYSDFSILLKIIQLGGNIFWTDEIVGNYGWHGSNLSSQMDLDEREKMYKMIMRDKALLSDLGRVKGWINSLIVIQAIKNRDVGIISNNINIISIKYTLSTIRYLIRLLKIRRLLRK